MIYSYDLNIPDDVPDAELEGYRQLAISTWRTAVEASGARPGDPKIELITRTGPEPVRNQMTGETAPGPGRAWRVAGPAL
jgi:hypothetical protein